MKRLADINDVINDWNYQFQQQEPIEDEEILKELLEMVTLNVLEQCEQEVKLRIINNKGQVELIGSNEPIP